METDSDLLSKHPPDERKGILALHLRTAASWQREIEQRHAATVVPKRPAALGRAKELDSLGMIARRMFQVGMMFVGGFILAGCTHLSAPSVMLEGTNTITIRYSDSYGLARFKHHPVIEASINGVTGPFVIDSGATIPFLNMTAIRRCGISVSSVPVKTGDFWGDKIGMKMATNICLQLARGVVVHWPEVFVHPGEDVVFGTIDYATLKAGQAVIDTKRETIRMTR